MTLQPTEKSIQTNYWQEDREGASTTFTPPPSPVFYHGPLSLHSDSREMPWRLIANMKFVNYVTQLVPQSGELTYKEACAVDFIRTAHFKEQNKQKHLEKKDKKKRPNLKKIAKKDRHLYQPQSGVMETLIMQRLKASGFNVDIMSQIENATLFFAVAAECVSVTQFFATLFLYFKTVYSPSIVAVAREFIMKSFKSTEYTPQSGVFGDIEYPSWLKELKNLSTTWTLALHAEGFSKIARLMSLCVAMGLCKASSIVPTVAGMELFTLPAVAKVTSAVSFVDAIFDLVIHFAEGGYVCFLNGSIAPLLYGSIDAQRLTENFHKCMRCSMLHGAGNLSKENLDTSGYDKLLQETTTLCSRMMAGARGSLEKQLFAKQLDKLNVWTAELAETRLTGGLRMSPFCVGLYGGTAVGKSTITPLLMITLLKANGFDAADENIATINESDKYMSNWKSYINGAVIDDIGNTKAQFVTEAPSDRIIQMVNNTPAYANMAGVEEKGKVAIEPYVVIITKNVKDSGASVYSNEPASIARRENFILTVNVKEEFASNKMIDSKKAAVVSENELFPDLWDITVETAFPLEGSARAPASIGYELVTDARGLPLENVSLKVAMRHLVESSKEHFKRQVQVVENAKNLSEKIEICTSCSLPSSWGSCALCAQCNPLVCPEVLQDPPMLLGGFDGNRNQGIYVAQDGWDFLKPKTIPELVESKIRSSVTPPSSIGAWFKSSFMSLATTIGFGPIVLGSYFYSRMSGFFTGKLKYYAPLTMGLISKLEIATTEVLIDRIDTLTDSPYASWTNWVPEWLVEKPFFREIYLATEWKTVQSRIMHRYWKAFVAACLPLIPVAAYMYSVGFRDSVKMCVDYSGTLSYIGISIGTLGFYAWPLRLLVQAVEEEKLYVYEELVSKRKDFMNPLAKRIRDNHLHWILGSSVVLAMIYGGIVYYRETYGVQEQGSLEPKDAKEIAQRDSEENPWKTAAVEETLPPAASKHVAFEDLSRLVCANLTSVSYESKGKKFHCDAFFPKSNVAIVPKHFWREDELTCHFVRREVSVVGANFYAKLSRQHSVDIEGADLSLVWVPSGGDWRDLSKFFPITLPKSTPARLYYKNLAGSIKSSKLMYSPDNAVKTTFFGYPGGYYDLEWNTFSGLCMAPLISEDRAPLILGFHLGGRPDTPHGASGCMLLSQLDQACKQLADLDGVLLSKSDVPHDKSQYEVQFFESTDIHARSPARFLTGAPSCRLYGSVKGKATYRSEVMPSPLSPHIEAICGIPQQWGKPKFNEGYKWQASLAKSSQPIAGFEGILVKKAYKCYLNGILELFDKHPHLKDTTKLTDIQTVSGIEGKRFVDPMKASTSIGYPLSGPKSNHMIDLAPDDDFHCPCTFTPEIWAEYRKTEAAYLRGERTTQIFKACMKDEPTKLSKDKVRIFQAASAVLQIGIRKYFLPLARILSLFPLTSECAVGINAESPEWEAMVKHIAKHGVKNIVAGDYAEYDLSMAAQLMFVGFRIFVEMARVCRYTPEDISIMEGFASEVCYAYTAFNGDLIKVLGSNPSGHNLTVYINSIVNSLLLRCAFYHIYPREKFRLRVSPMTYGDDVEAGVSKSVPKYNHISIAQFFAEHGLKFTMPDKTSTPTPYMDLANVDFLKRKNYWNADLNCYVGILEDGSVFKSLHAQMPSKHATHKQIAAQNIDGAMRTWFFHGREVFDMRRTQMQEVARRADLEHMVLNLNKNYDEYVGEWWEQHRKDIPYKGPVKPKPL